MSKNSNESADGAARRTPASSDRFASYVPRLLELVNDLVISVSTDGRQVLYANSAAAVIYGRKLSEILGQENLWMECIHDDDQAPLLAKIKSIGQERTFEQEFRVVQPDGTIRYLTANFRRIIGADNELVAIGCIAKDVTNRIRAEFKLEESKAIYHSLVESLPINVFRKDRDGRIVFVNNKYCETIGMSRENLIGLTDFDLFEPDLAEKYLKDDRWVLQTGLPFHDIEAHPDGEGTMYVEVLKAPVTSSGGRRIGIQGMFWDVTDRKKAEIEMEKAKDIAIAASQAKSDFLANVSHEIRTPLNAVIGMTDLLIGSKADDTQREYLTMIQDSGQSLLTLINDILDFSKIESGKLNIDTEWFDLRDRAGDMLRSLAFKAHHKNLDLICNIDPEIPGPILGDPQRLRQVIVNLVGNSIKFTHTGEIAVDIELMNRSEESVELQFRIQDTGIGIPEDKLSRIFEEFVQGDTSTTRQYGGTGLGLTIASSLVELMGGRLEVSSKLDVGTEFCFSLTFPISSNSTAPVAPVEFRDIRILIMARNAANLNSLECNIKAWHMEPYCVRDVEQAVKLAKGMNFSSQPIQIVLAESSADSADTRGCNAALLAQRMREDPDIETPAFITLINASSAKLPGEESGYEQQRLLQPVKYSELKNAIARCLEPATAPSTGPQLEQSHLEGPFKILLAEDNPVNQKLAVGVLKKHEHDITVVDNGRKAVDALESESFDLVLMDVQMPEMDGIEATKTIRSSVTVVNSSIPIIAMTAHAMPADRQRCLEAGMDEYISKPFKAADLLSLITQLMTSRTTEKPSGIGGYESESNSEIDWNVAFETVGGDRQLLVELIQVFLNEREKMLGDLESGLEQADFERARRSAHSLKGTFSHLGVASLAKMSEAIERLDDSEIANAKPMVQDLRNKIEQLTTEFQRFTNN